MAVHTLPGTGDLRVFRAAAAAAAAQFIILHYPFRLEGGGITYAPILLDLILRTANNERVIIIHGTRI